MKVSSITRALGFFWTLAGIAYLGLTAIAMLNDQPHDIFLLKAFVMVAFGRISFLEAKVEDGQ